MPSMELKPWGSALEHLREMRGLSKGDVCRKAGIERPEYRVICYKLTKGPSMDKVGALLKALGCTWTEWGADVRRAAGRRTAARIGADQEDGW